MYIVTLKKNEEKELSMRPWVYANEVLKVSGKDEQGSIARVESSNGVFVGYGFINHYSKILVRLLSRNENETFDKTFFYERIKKAKENRERLQYGNSYRAVFSESDGLPGLIVDKYDVVLSIQILTLGMEKRKDLLVDILKDLFQPQAIYERSDVPIREKEGLEQRKGLLFGTLPDKLQMEENGLSMYIDVENGQKTGYFLDQRENRLALRSISKGKDVLDCFCNQGGFSLNAALGGANSVTSVDVSDLALEKVNENAKANHLLTISTINADVFALLRQYKNEGRKFDIIVLDPPAFTKTADTVQEGYKGYLDINTIALKLLQDDGILVTCSCSQHMTLPLFFKMIAEASQHANIPIKLLDVKCQAKDHASLISLQESLYLKVLYVQKTSF